mmetsp:Transcript_34744/g.69205  ORF Transcript_34744/g.69205 Transcript_34744/m.69205 type:complete len:375 (+) Transcript_34744:162-1286(+)
MNNWDDPREWQRGAIKSQGVITDYSKLSIDSDKFNVDTGNAGGMNNANMENMAEMAGIHGGDQRDGKANRVAQYSTDDHLYVTGAGRILEKDGGEFNVAPKQGYVKLHDSIEADRKAFEASKAAMHQGKARDADGTVDRISDTADDKLFPLLYLFKRRCEAENIELNSVFEEAGGTHFGTIKRQNFQSALVSTFKRMLLEENTLFAIVDAYGCGYKHPANPSVGQPALYESVGWKDFVEDVMNVKPEDVGPNSLLGDELSKVRSCLVAPEKLGLTHIQQQNIWSGSAWDEIEGWTQVEDDGSICVNPFKVSGSRVADQNKFDDHNLKRASFVNHTGNREEILSISHGYGNSGEQARARPGGLAGSDAVHNSLGK